MENHVEDAVGATVGVQGRAEGVAEKKKNWVAPELRKFEIAEVTALNSNMSHPDAGLGSS